MVTAGTRGKTTVAQSALAVGGKPSLMWKAQTTAFADELDEAYEMKREVKDDFMALNSSN